MACRIVSCCCWSDDNDGLTNGWDCISGMGMNIFLRWKSWLIYKRVNTFLVVVMMVVVVVSPGLVCWKVSCLSKRFPPGPLSIITVSPQRSVSIISHSAIHSKETWLFFSSTCIITQSPLWEDLLYLSQFFHSCQKRSIHFFFIHVVVISMVVEVRVGRRNGCNL